MPLQYGAHVIPICPLFWLCGCLPVWQPGRDGGRIRRLLWHYISWWLLQRPRLGRLDRWGNDIGRNRCAKRRKDCGRILKSLHVSYFRFRLIPRGAHDRWFVESQPCSGLTGRLHLMAIKISPLVLSSVSQGLYSITQGGRAFSSENSRGSTRRNCGSSRTRCTTAILG
jgi:hypothetical protein